MRKMLWVAVCGFALVITMIAITPLRFVLFPQPLTSNQRAILSRANAGLEVLASKSTTANSFALEAKHFGSWTRFISVMPTTAISGTTKGAFSVTVMSSNPHGMIAFYLHPIHSVCFMEANCESLGFYPLGLTYAHELGHRRDFEQGLIKISDLPESRPVIESEARCKFIEAAILSEYTDDRFSQAVDRHLATYNKLAPLVRKKQTVDEFPFDVDVAWVKQEFGALSSNDDAQILNTLLFSAGVRQLLAKSKANHQDSLDAAIHLMKHK